MLSKFKKLVEDIVMCILFPMFKLLGCIVGIAAFAWAIDFIRCKW